MLPISTYIPGRFEYMMQTPFAQALWGLLSSDESMSALTRSTDDGKPAIYPLLSEIEDRFANQFTSSEYRDDDATVLVNNMIKQIMEYHGYKHIACGLCPQGRFIKVSGAYAKRDRRE